MLQLSRTSSIANVRARSFARPSPDIAYIIPVGTSAGSKEELWLRISELSQRSEPTRDLRQDGLHQCRALQIALVCVVIELSLCLVERWAAESRDAVRKYGRWWMRSEAFQRGRD
eukprot:3937059-Rhodomonas_salina.2